MKIKQYKDLTILSIIIKPMTNPLEHIAFEKIDDEFVYGKYGDFTVIMMKRNGYINATKMCEHISEQTGSKKPYFNWTKNQSANELIGEIETSQGYKRDELFKVITGGQNMEIRGTYVHPDLIPHIACWASPKFAVKVSNIVNKYFNQKELRKKERLINEQKIEIKDLKKQLEEQHAETQRKLDEQHAEAQRKMDEQHAESQAKLDKVLHKNKKISHRLRTVKRQNIELLEKVDNIAEDRVVNPVDDRDKHEFILMKNTDPQAECIKRYHAIRTKRRLAKTAIKRYQNENPNSIILLEIEYNPNAINLWDRIRAHLHDKMRMGTRGFGLRGRYTEDEFVADIRELNDEKYDV